MQGNLETKRPPALESDESARVMAEYSDTIATARCWICNSFVFEKYYRVNDQLACARCAGEARQGQPSDTRAAFARGLVLGVGAALVGLALYSTFNIVSNFYFGYIALGVGWLVAKAILKGSNGIGGRRYQIAAVLLTYIAISTSAVPIKIANIVTHNKVEVLHHRNPDTAEGGSANQQYPAPAKLGIRGIVLKILVLGIASPFLYLQDPWHGLAGVVILLIGLHIAYRFAAARTLDVVGPFWTTVS